MTRSPLERVAPGLLTAMPPLRPLLFLAALCLLLTAEAIAARSGPTGWRVVLVAGDNAQPVFDNAVAAVRNWLTAGGVPAQNIQVLSATPRQDAGAAAEPAWAGWI